jgi:hypothetical protein
MNLNTIASVYEIRNVRTKDAYVGSTFGSAGRRYSQHLWRLTAGTHPNSALQKLWAETPINEWIFRILETGIAWEQQIAREAVWVQKLAPTLNKARVRGLPATRNPETVARVLELRNAGSSLRAIAKECKTHLATVHTIVSRYSRKGSGPVPFVVPEPIL